MAKLNHPKSFWMRKQNLVAESNIQWSVKLRQLQWTTLFHIDANVKKMRTSSYCSMPREKTFRKIILPFASCQLIYFTVFVIAINRYSFAYQHTPAHNVVAPLNVFVSHVNRRHAGTYLFRFQFQLIFSRRSSLIKHSHAVHVYLVCFVWPMTSGTLDLAANWLNLHVTSIKHPYQACRYIIAHPPCTTAT